MRPPWWRGDFACLLRVTQNTFPVPRSWCLFMRSQRACLLSVSIAVACTSAIVAADKPADVAFFEKRIRPVLVEHCYECHAADAKKVRGGLLLDSREAMRRGGDSGAGVVPGDTDESLVLQALRYESYEMPPERSVARSKSSAISRSWIDSGAS